MKKYLRLNDLEIYKISREVSKLVWNIYEGLDIDQRIMFGQQFVRSVDSIGANIAEG